ncbi:hypothetical protein [Chloroflexus sp.]|nr:hypothetical protein [Chloroflexus sp.]
MRQTAPIAMIRLSHDITAIPDIQRWRVVLADSVENAVPANTHSPLS